MLATENDQMPPLLCKLRMHKWRYYGESVLIIWKEPGLLPGVKTTRHKHVLSRRECPRCKVKQKRIFSENIDGTMAAAGWETAE